MAYKISRPKTRTSQDTQRLAQAKKNQEFFDFLPSSITIKTGKGLANRLEKCNLRPPRPKDCTVPAGDLDQLALNTMSKVLNTDAFAPTLLRACLTRPCTTARIELAEHRLLGGLRRRWLRCQDVSTRDQNETSPTANAGPWCGWMGNAVGFSLNRTYSFEILLAAQVSSPRDLDSPAFY